MALERGHGIKKYFVDMEKHQGQRVARFFQRRTGVVLGATVLFNNGESRAMGGMETSCSASVGQEPMHDKQPTHRFSTTTTGRLA